MTGPTPDWAAQLRGLAEAASSLLAGGPGPDGVPSDHAAECRTCPVCTALAVLRGRRPDLSEALADVLTTAATALRAHARPTADPEPAPEHPEERVSRPAAPVQHIDVA